MMKSKSLWFLVWIATTAATSADAKWDSMGEEDGIKTFRRTVEGSPLVAFRGEGVVEARIGTIVSMFFVEYGKSVEWVDLLEEIELIEERTPHHLIFREHFDQPWPVSDRDFVFEVKGQADANTKTFTARYRSVQVPGMGEQSCCVRGEIIDTYFRFTAQPNGTTLIECEVIVDPKGMLPKWVVNMVQKGWPVNTINGIRRQAAKADAPADPAYADWH